MREEKISLKTAYLAKEKGFNGCFLNLAKPEVCTQSRLAKWLRDKHGKHCQITAEYYKDGINWNYQILWSDSNDYDYKNGTGMYGDNGEYPTYEKCLEAALIHALILL